jgi:hypothetical protein
MAASWNDAPRLLIPLIRRPASSEGVFEMTRFSIVLAVTMALAGQAQAGGRCNQPYAPVIKINASASAHDVATLHDDVQSFISASDVYQQCLIAQGGGDKEARMDANQAQKLKVGQQFNEVLHAFKKAHPG